MLDDTVSRSNEISADNALFNGSWCKEESVEDELDEADSDLYVANEDSFSAYVRKYLNTDLLTRKSEAALARKVQMGDAAARDAMIKANMRLVVKIASAYKYTEVPMADLVSEGNIGLMRAVEKFDPEKGFRFSTYATWWIKQSIRSAISGLSHSIRLPSSFSGKRRTYLRLIREAEESGVIISDEELSEILGVTSDRLKLMQDTQTKLVSLDTPVGDSDSTMVELLGDDGKSDAFNAVATMELKERIEKVLKAFTDRRVERVLRGTFGIGVAAVNGRVMAKELNVSHQMIALWERQGLRELRRTIYGLEEKVPDNPMESFL